MINASAKSSTPRQLPPAGTHIARAYQVIDLGTTTKEWPGRPARKTREIRISWELPNEKAVFSPDKGEEPFSVHRTYTLSLSEKANLRHDLESWRSRPFSEAELAKFDVAKILGTACMVTVQQVTKGENTYANVTAVTALPKGMPAPAAVNKPVEYSLESHDEAVFAALPDFLKEIIQKSDEWKSAREPAVVGTHPADDPGEDDEIPGIGPYRGSEPDAPGEEPFPF